MAYSPPGSSVPGIFPGSGLPFPPPGHLPNPGIEPTPPAPPELASGFTTEPPGKPQCVAQSKRGVSGGANAMAVGGSERPA